MSKQKKGAKSSDMNPVDETPVEILATAGITEENKHDFSTLGTILSKFTFKGKGNRLRVTREIVNKIQAISMLLLEAAHKYPTDVDKEPPSAVCNSSRPTKKRKISQTFDDTEAPLKRDAEVQTVASLEPQISLDHLTKSDTHNLESFDAQFEISYYNVMHYETVSPKNEESPSPNLKPYTPIYVPSSPSYHPTSPRYMPASPIPDHTKDNIESVFSSPVITDLRQLRRSSAPSPVQHSRSTKELPDNWLLEPVPYKMLGQIIVVVRSYHTDFKGGVYEHSEGIVKSLTRSSNGKMEGLVELLCERKEILVPIEFLRPCPPRGERDEVLILRGASTSCTRWMFEKLDGDNVHVTVSNGHLYEVHPYYHLVSCA